jgi:hypothetical protein
MQKQTDKALALSRNRVALTAFITTDVLYEWQKILSYLMSLSDTWTSFRAHSRPRGDTNLSF